MKKLLLLLFLFAGTLLHYKSYSQALANDSIIVYDLKSKTTTLILPAAYNTTVTFDHTVSAVGGLGNQIPLNLTPPTTNLFSGTNFNDLEKAADYFNVSDYPLRTAVKLFRYSNDTLKGRCSAIMVGENLVLTAAHCVRNISSPVWVADSFLVAPAFDNGAYQTTIPTSKVEKCYVYKSFYDNVSILKDIALLQLELPIGKQTGWVGMAFNTDSAYFSNNVFHKLSYPGVVSPFDPTKIYNGDTLYYNYGNIFAPNANQLAINSASANGIPGQSGSSFFYTDNNSDYYSYGVMSWSMQCTHTRITNKIFYDFKNIQDNYAVGIESSQLTQPGINIYPNPFHEYAVIEFNNPSNEVHHLIIYNSFGQQVRNLTGSDTAFKIDRSDLSNGLYLFQLQNPSGDVFHGKLIVN